ncbi:MAG: anti-sigma factor antagonist [Pseudonocardiaceae bacterium]|nr:anti-sigma factor antagonist [Pseudonocardiaceae bacterium]
MTQRLSSQPATYGGSAGRPNPEVECAFRRVFVVDPTATPAGGARLDVTAEHDPETGSVVLYIAGEVDLATADTFDEQLRGYLVAGNTRVILELTQVGFLGSAGLAALVAAARRADELDLALRLVTDTHPVLRPLEITGLRELFEIRKTVDEAIRT